MNPLAFIARLQKQNARSVRVFNDNFLDTVVFPRNGYIVVTDESQHPVGYLLHSCCRPGCAVRLEVICVRKGARKRGHGRKMINLLLARAATYGTAKIVTWCPSHLQATGFFEHLNFVRTARKRERTGQIRFLHTYSLEVPPNPTPQDAPKSPQSHWNGYPRAITVEALRRFHGLPEGQAMKPI